MHIATRAPPGVAVRASKSSPAMPDPDPQPPKPRAVSPARWLLMLLPSVPMLLTPSQIETVGMDGPWEAEMTYLALRLALGLASAAALSFAIGLKLEKWEHGFVENKFRAVGFGIAILFANCLIASLGCTAFPITARQ